MALKPEKFDPADYFKNPGYLKLDLMLRGVRVDPSLTKRGKVLPEYYLSDGIYGNLDLVLPHDIYVSVPYQEGNISDSPYKLRFFRNKFYLTFGKYSVKVKVLPKPNYFKKKLNDKLEYGNILSAHGSFVSLSLGGHRYLQPHLFGKAASYVPTVDEVIDVLDFANSESKIDVLAMSTWDTSGDDGGINSIEPYIRAIKSTFNLLLFIEIHLPKHRKFMDKTYAVGADSVCYHLGDLCSHGSDERVDSSHVMSMEEEIDLLKYAVSIYPQGTILSHITMGNRPLDDVKQDISRLTEIGVLPILTGESREVLLNAGYNIEEYAGMFKFVYEEAKKRKIKMNWFSKMSPFMTPIEGYLFTPDKPYFKLALMNFYQSRLFGGNISARLSDLRRNLRVREVKPK